MASSSSHPPTPHRRPNSASSNHGTHYNVDPKTLPLDEVLGNSALEELSDSMATLDSNMQQLQTVHESLSRFSESFSAFLYGIKMNAWCVEFSEAPSGESFNRDRTPISEQSQPQQQKQQEDDTDVDTTYATDNQSFIVQPKTTNKPVSKKAVTKTPVETQSQPKSSYIPRKTTTSAAKARQMAQQRAKQSQWR